MGLCSQQLMERMGHGGGGPLQERVARAKQEESAQKRRKEEAEAVFSSKLLRDVKARELGAERPG